MLALAWATTAKDSLKLLSAFCQIFIFHQMIGLQKLWKMFFILSKKPFRSQDIHIFLFPSSPLFLLVSHCFRGWFKINLKVYDIINCQNKNLIRHFVWYLGKEKRYAIETSSIDSILKKTFLWKNQAENVHQKLVPDSFLILVINPKQPLHIRNFF